MTVVGSNTAYRTLRARGLVRVPAGVDAAEAATLILSWTTAYLLLHRAARVQPGQRVLVQGAAGAVGQALLVLGNKCRHSGHNWSGERPPTHDRAIEPSGSARCADRLPPCIRHRPSQTVCYLSNKPHTGDAS
jgi:hypothetical protein